MDSSETIDYASMYAANGDCIGNLDEVSAQTFLDSAL